MGHGVDANGKPLFEGLSVGCAYVDGHYATWEDLDRLKRRVDYMGDAMSESTGHEFRLLAPGFLQSPRALCACSLTRK